MKYEYQIISGSVLNQGELNREGEHGWELIFITPLKDNDYFTMQYIFKRLEVRE